MAEGQTMTAADVVAQVRDGRLEDFVPRRLWVARELTESEVSPQVGAERGEVAPADLSQWVSPAAPSVVAQRCRPHDSERLGRREQGWSRGWNLADELRLISSAVGRLTFSASGILIEPDARSLAA
jgi:hypothetical protein